LTNCIVCTKPFPKQGVRKLCSLECKQERWRQISNKGTAIRRGHKYSNCIICKKQFQKKTGNPSTCSNYECRKLGKTRISKAYNLKFVKCKFCHKYKERKKSLKSFCSVICERNYQKKHLGNCVICKKQIFIQNSRQKSCSNECRKELVKQNRTKLNKLKLEIKKEKAKFLSQNLRQKRELEIEEKKRRDQQ